VGVRLGGFSFERSLEWYVNDALMVIFFFVVGLEIRREMHHGELSEWRRAAIPAAAALGGMLAPAGLYLAFAGEPSTRSGWGVPMATDIAFAVGILTLLGKRAPAALRVLLLAVAVIDDLGAIVVIALFYSSGVSLVGLLVAALGVLGVFAMQRLGVRSKLAYIAPPSWPGRASTLRASTPPSQASSWGSSRRCAPGWGPRASWPAFVRSSSASRRRRRARSTPTSSPRRCGSSTRRAERPCRPPRA
jgi:hypothetical protein